MTRTRLITGIALLACALPAAQAGDAERGKPMAAKCAGCHNTAKQPLAGKPAEELAAAMKSIRAGEQAHPPLLKNLSDEDLADLAAYFASLTLD